MPGSTFAALLQPHLNAPHLTSHHLVCLTTCILLLLLPLHLLYNFILQLDKRYPLVLFPAFRLQDRMMKSTLGEKSWVKVHESINRQRKIQEYMDAHGGQRPPDSFLKKHLKKACRCFFKKEKNLDMERIAKAQKETKEKMKRNENDLKKKKALAAAA